MTVRDRLSRAWKKNNSLLCIGLDTDAEKIPQVQKNTEYLQYEFNKAIIDATHDLVAAYKPNAAFYESRGEEGIRELKMTCDYIKDMYPDLLLILDAKRADIGNTNEGYARFAFDYLGADAITLHPYLGHEALAPFLGRKDKGCIILCRTSNQGAGELQDLQIDGKPLYLNIAERVSGLWNENENCMLVVGATYPKELAAVRSVAGNIPILVPGIGAQGGDLRKTLDAGLTPEKTGLFINASRSVIFAGSGSAFAVDARREAQKVFDEMKNIISREA